MKYARPLLLGTLLASAGVGAGTEPAPPIRVLIVDGFGTAIRIRPDGSLERIPPGHGASTGHGPRSDRAIHL